MADLLEITVTLFRPGSSAASLGLLLLYVDDHSPPAICDIIDGSPAAECEQIEIGDVIIEINNKDVQAYSIKEVMKCLKLAQNPVTLKLIRDPAVKNKVYDQLEYNVSQESLHDMNSKLLQYHSPPSKMASKSNSNKIKCPKFESCVIKDNRVVKLSLNAELSLLPKKNKKSQVFGINESSMFQKVNCNSDINDQPKIVKCNSGIASLVSSPSKMSKCKQGSHSKNPSQSNSQHPMTCTASINTKDVDFTSTNNILVDTIMKPIEKDEISTYNADHVSNNISDFHSFLPEDMILKSVSRSLKPLSSDQLKPTKEMLCDTGYLTSSYLNTSCSEIQDTTDSDFLIDSSELKVTCPNNTDSTILASKPKIEKCSTNILCAYDTHMDQQFKQIESSDRTKLVRSSKNNKSYYNKEKNIKCVDQNIINNDNYHFFNIDLETGILHDSRYFPKPIDMPSAARLAKRLFYLEGFKSSDVSYHLSKNDEFSKAVAEKYLAYFEFKDISLDMALRRFLNHFTLTGQTEDRERVLGHFSKRYLNCNPPRLCPTDSMHALTCAIVQLNYHLHNQTNGCKITHKEFVKSLTGLNNNGNFSRHVLKSLYYAIKNDPLEKTNDFDLNENQMQNLNVTQPIDNFEKKITSQLSENESRYENVSTQTLEHKKGYVLRKHCLEPNGKKTLKIKRNWKLYYCTIQNLFLYLQKCNSEFHKPQIVDDVIPIHHGLATRAIDYKKKPNVFRLVTDDQSEYLFQTRDEKELNSWIDSINFVCASLSPPQLPSAIGNHRKFQRPLLPSAPTKLNLQEQLCEHENTLNILKTELNNLLKQPKRQRSIFSQFHNEEYNYLLGELKRYTIYVKLMKSKMIQVNED